MFYYCSNFILLIVVCNQSKYTVPVKCKLTVSTRNSILDPRYFRESSFEFRGSSFEFRGSSIEFRVSRRSKNFSRKRFKSRICNNGRNNTALGAASFIRARVHVFHINVQIVSLELVLNRNYISTIRCMENAYESTK